MRKIIEHITGVAAVSAVFLLLFERSGSYLSTAMSSYFRLINTVILSLFVLDVVLSFFFSKNKIRHILKNWLDFVVFIPFAYHFFPKSNETWNLFLFQIVVIFVAFSRFKKAEKFVESVGLRPAQIMSFSFLFVICAGAVILTLPFATNESGGASLIDALFTSTSAVCVTGLIVQDTATYFTGAGQLVILLLIQLGGLGIMTFSVFIAMLSGKKMDFGKRAAMQDVLDSDTLSELNQLIKFIFIMTFTLEIAGAVLLTVAWFGRFESFFELLFHSTFHSVSAFCNAGFSTFTDSLVGFSTDVPTIIVISFLIIFGGLGFATVYDIKDGIKNLFRDGKKKFRFKVGSKIVLLFTAFLIIFGTAALFFTELDGFSFSEIRINALKAFFQSVTSRTAGFNTVEIKSLAPASLLFIIFLMVVGASPGSTGGGLKTTTFAVLLASMKNTFSKGKNVEIFKRTIPYETVIRAFKMLFLYLSFTLFIFFLLLLTENIPFSDLMFESFSAIGTVGLSTGITSQLSSSGKFLVMILMFVGRLGPLTIGYTLVSDIKKANYSYAEEKVMIG